MPKQFYTEKDIEDLYHSGVQSLQVTDDIVLTELAYEKAKRLGVQLISHQADHPPGAPVRPYLADRGEVQVRTTIAPAPNKASSQPPHAPTTLSDESLHSARDGDAVEQRIRSAVIAKLGSQVEAKLLDTIIHRVVKGLGLK